MSRPRASVADLLLVSVLLGAAWSALALGRVEGSVRPLAAAAALSAAVLLAAAGVAAADRRAQLIAGAVGAPALGVLLAPAVGMRGQGWLLLSHLAGLGVAALLAMAAGWTVLQRAHARLLTLGWLGAVLTATAAVTVSGTMRPGWTPPAELALVTGGLAWSGLATAAGLLVVAGARERLALLRRVGLAIGLALLAALGVAPGVFALAGVALLVVAAAAQLRQGSLPAPPARPTPPPAPVPAPARPAPGRAPARSSTVGPIAAGPVVDDMAVLYRALGLDVQVEVRGDPWVGLDGGGLAQLLAKLLANCARHAPGAQVQLRATARGSRVRIEVIDDGPGLPPGSTARLLRRGERGAGSTGAGLGLAVCAELVDRHRGSLTVVSTAAGCTAVVDLPAAPRRAPVLSG